MKYKQSFLDIILPKQTIISGLKVTANFENLTHFLYYTSPWHIKIQTNKNKI